MAVSGSDTSPSTKAGAIFDRILGISAFVSGVMLLAIMISVSLDVIFRYFLHSPIRGVDEISEILQLYITFLGTAWLLKRGGHVTIDILFTRFKPKTQAWLTFIFSVVGAIMSLVLVWYGTTTTLDFWQRGIITPTILQPPRALIVAVIPVGGLLLLLQFVRRAWQAYVRR